MKDIEYMRAALALARRGLGRTAPNPSVGCVLVNKGHIVGRGWTADSGRPHAETIALQQAGPEARGATAYVTLEPCAHHGQTPPCAEALVKAGVRRVVIGCGDPDPRVAGRGVEILQRETAVTLDVLKEECIALNRGFFLRVSENRPMVTLKAAVTNNGMFASSTGKRQWITGFLARRHVHLERSLHDAILVGIGTVLHDDPLLTTRLEGITHKGPRIILDSELKIPLDSQLVRTADENPLWIFHRGDPHSKAPELEKRGARLFTGFDDLGDILETLADEGLTRLLVEGGERTIRAFAEAGVGDQFLLYRAPQVNWAEGRSLHFPEMMRKLDLELKETRFLGEDLLEIYGRKA